MIEYESIYSMCKAYADWCNENDHLHGRTNSDDYYLYFVSKKISGKDTKDTVTFCFTGATRPDGSHPGYLIQTS